MKSLVHVTAMLAAVAFVVNAIADDSGDRRPVLLLDIKDVIDKTPAVHQASGLGHRGGIAAESGGVNKKGILDEVEKVLSDIGSYHVVSKSSIERSIQEKELFDFLNGQGSKEVKLRVPAYRMEIDVLQYRTEAKSETYQYRKKKTHMRTDITQSASVEILFKIIDIKTSEAIFAENFSSQKGGNQSFMEKSGKVGDAKGVNAYLSQAFAEVMQAFREKLIETQPIHILGCTDDGVLTLDAVTPVVNTGDLLKVYSLGVPITSKRTGKTTRSETEVATIRVTSANTESSTAEFADIITADCDWHVVVRRIKKEKKQSIREH